MNNGEIKSCIKIINKLMKRPLLKIFDDHIKKLPITLEKIQEKLYSNIYNNFFEFYDDTKTVFSSLEEVTREIPWSKICIEDLREYFDKKIKKCFPSAFEIETKTKNLVALCHSIANSINDTPSTIMEFKKRTFHNASEPFYREFSYLEMEFLSEAINIANSTKIRNGVIAIFKALGNVDKNSITSDFHVNINKCSPQCLHTIRNYLKEQFEIEGLTYPE